MADKAIGELPRASFVDDESLFVMEQQAEAYSVSGRIFKNYAREGVQVYVEDAKQAAVDAAKSKDEAAQSAADAAQSAADAANSAQSAQDYSGKPPMIQNGTWWIWNAATQQYEDTGYAARGDVMYATFEIIPQTGELVMTTPDGYNGPVFYLINGYLEVSVNA